MTLSYAAQATFTWDTGSGLPQVLDDGSFRYVYGLGRIAEIGAGATTHYYLADGLGSVMALTDSSGRVVNTYEYDVFGAMRSSTGSQANAFTFTGEQTDASTGLEYLRARYYEAGTGRLMSEDPLSGITELPASQNVFPYVLNNPVNLLDPSGMCVFGAPCPTEIKKAGKIMSKGAECLTVNQVGGALEAANAGITAAGRALDLQDLGYLDVNLSGCFEFCLTAGFQVSFGERLHPYAGAGVGTPQLGVNATVAPGQHISTGLNCGVQLGFGSPGIGISRVIQYGAAGVRTDKEGNLHAGAFLETGVGAGFSAFPIAISATCMFIL